MEKNVGIIPLINPSAGCLSGWEWVLLVVATWSLITAPLFACYAPAAGFAVLPVEYVIDFVFLLDMLVKFRMIHQDVWGRLVTDERLIRRKYVRDGSFNTDLIALLPLELVLAGWMWTPTAVLLCRLNKGFRCVRLLRSHKLAELKSVLARIGRLLSGFLLLAHWLGCLFFAVSRASAPLSADAIGWRDGSYVTQFGLDARDPGEQYIECLYFIVVTMVTVGYGDVRPVNVYERAFAIVTTLISGIVYAFIFGEVALLIQNQGAEWQGYRQKLDSINRFARLYELPTELKAKMQAYTMAAWQLDRGMDKVVVLQDLPEAVRVQVMLHLHEGLINQVHLFKKASAAFLRALVLRFELGIILEGDFLFQQGDIGETMYVIRHGLLEVLVAAPTTGEALVGTAAFDAPPKYDRVRVMGPGAFFGEISLILRQQRTASIRAKSRCDFYRLKKADFDELLELFPEQREGITDTAGNRLVQDVKRAKSSGRLLGADEWHSCEQRLKEGLRDVQAFARTGSTAASSKYRVEAPEPPPASKSPAAQRSLGSAVSFSLADGGGKVRRASGDRLASCSFAAGPATAEEAPAPAPAEAMGGGSGSKLDALLEKLEFVAGRVEQVEVLQHAMINVGAAVDALKEEQVHVRRQLAALGAGGAPDAGAGGGSRRGSRPTSLQVAASPSASGSPSPLADCGQAGRRTSTDEVDAHFAHLRGARRSTDASSSLLVDPAPPPPGGEWGDDDVESIGSDDAVPPPDI